MSQTTRRPYELSPHAIKTVEQDGAAILFRTDNDVILRLEIITDYIVRFRYTTEGFFLPDFSYAIYKNFESSFQKSELLEKEGHYEILTVALKIHIQKENLKATVYDVKTGLELNRDEKGFHWEEHPTYGGNIVMMSKMVQNSEQYYGLGDKAMNLNLKGKRLKLWGMDEYGFSKDQDPLYKNIPFYIGMHHKQAYGIFFDNTFKSYFDFASERNTVTSFWAHGGEMNYYFIYGPGPIDVVEKYAYLTGKPELPPMWALGFHQCKWSYFPEQTVRNICQEFRDRKIPCDAIYLDIDYMDGFRCFTWDYEKFPNPTKMIKDLEEQGFKTVAILDPGIKIDHENDVFKEAFERGYFCKRADGTYMKGKVWPGECYFIDFTLPEAREWWSGLFKGLVAENGIKGIWNDMNEPAVFEVESKTFPPDVRHDYDGHSCSHRKAHNIYGMQMARATYHGVKRNSRPNRPFVITRSLYSGTQRYSATWTGDNIASWEHLSLANIQCQRMSISGHSFIGSDIGGFIDHPSSELFIRWMQLGIFHPMMRVHSSGDHGAQEPWSFSEEATRISKKFIEIRYRLLPYLYTTFWQNTQRGTPMVRPLAFVDFSDENTLFRNDEFLFGDHIFACPVVEPGATSRYLYLPEGNWYYYFSNEQIKGGLELSVDTPLDEMPIFIRSGAVVPHYPVMQYVGEYALEKLTLKLYFGHGKTRSELYEDAGDGYEYRKDQFSLKTFTQIGKDDEVVLRQHRSGKYNTEYDRYALDLIGLPFTPSRLIIDDIETEIAPLNSENGDWSINVPASFEVVRVLE